MKKILNWISDNPRVSIILRKILEFNFAGEKKLIRKYLAVKLGEKVLDLGCGTGEFSVCFGSEGYVGIDISSANIQYAAGHYDKKFLVADAKSLPFPDKFFDKILVVGVLHHLDDGSCRRALLEMRRVLKPDGTVLVIEDTVGGGLLSSLIHRLDMGANIRKRNEWENLLGECFNIEMSQSLTSGFCFYTTFLLKV